MSDLFDPKVSINLSWPDLFRKDFPPHERRKRWEDWKDCAMRQEDRQRGRDTIEFWTGHECGPCDQVDGDWCNLQGLPCTVNPILTFKHGYIGFACMGFYPSSRQRVFERQIKALISSGLKNTGPTRQACYDKAEQIWDKLYRWYEWNLKI